MRMYMYVSKWTIGFPVRILVGLGRARSELSATRRVVGSDGLSDYT